MLVNGNPLRFAITLDGCQCVDGNCGHGYIGGNMAGMIFIFCIFKVDLLLVKTIIKPSYFHCFLIFGCRVIPLDTNEEKPI